MKSKYIQAAERWRKIDFRELFAYSEILKRLIIRDIKLRYSQTFLGVAWVVLQPLVMGGLFSLIFGNWLKLESEGVPYILFAFCGLVPWTFVSQGIQRATSGLQGDKAILGKIYFPRLLIPLSVILVSMIDVAILVSVLVLLIKIMGGVFSSHVWLFPLCMGPVFFLTLGLGSFVSSLAIYYRDVLNLLPFFLQIFMYLSPVLYSSQMVKEKWRFLYEMNPLVGIIDACRWCFLNKGGFPLESFLISAAVSLVVGALGVFIFTQLERHFADWV